MMKSIKYINFEEWLKRDELSNDNDESSKKKKNDKKNKNVKKSFYINNIEEVLESNFEEIILEMKNNSYNSVIAIGESFYKDPTNYSERYPDITKFTEYVNNEFTRMIDNIINKKEIFIDGKIIKYK